MRCSYSYGHGTLLSFYRDGQNYSDGFKSIEECVENAKGFGCKVGDVIYVGEAKKVPIKGVDLSDECTVI